MFKGKQVISNCFLVCPPPFSFSSCKEEVTDASPIEHGFSANASRWYAPRLEAANIHAVTVAGEHRPRHWAPNYGLDERHASKFKGKKPVLSTARQTSRPRVRPVQQAAPDDVIRHKCACCWNAEIEGFKISYLLINEK